MKKFFRASVTGRCSCDKKSRQQAPRFQLFSCQIARVFCLIREAVCRLKLCFWFQFYGNMKMAMHLHFFITALEVKDNKVNFTIFQNNLFFIYIWTWVAGAPRTTSWRFSPVAGAYGDLCKHQMHASPASKICIIICVQCTCIVLTLQALRGLPLTWPVKIVWRQTE